MPVIAVVAAVALDAGAIGAAVAGTLTTLAAVTAIGATLGAVGAVTGNKTLGLIGAGLGLVGAVGTIASGAGVFDNVSDLFSSSDAAAGDVASGATDSLGVAGGAAPDSLGVAGGVAEGASPADITAASGALDTAAITPQGMINSALAPAEGDAAAIAGAGDQSGLVTSALSGDATSGAGVAGNAPGLTTTQLAGTMPTKLADITTPMLSNGQAAASTGGILNWAKNNPLLAYGVLQAGGSFISGLTNPMTPAQIQALQAQAAYNNAAAAMTTQETKNIQSGMPSANTVTGKPATGQSLINHAPAQANVTGTINATPKGAPVTGATA